MEKTQLGSQAIHACINTNQTLGASLWRGQAYSCFLSQQVHNFNIIIAALQ